MLTGLFAPMGARFLASQVERRATHELGKQVANGVRDVSENIVLDTVSGGMADFVEGATGYRPSNFTGAPSVGGLGSAAYTKLWGAYNKGVADDVSKNAIPQRSTLFTLGANVGQVASYDRLRHMVNNANHS